MKSIKLLALFICLSNTVLAQKFKVNAENFDFKNVRVQDVKILGKKATLVLQDTTVKTKPIVNHSLLKNMDFHNGTIEVKVLARLWKNAPAAARGFIGITFRGSADNSKYEAFYIRPTNGRADDQVRRNHTLQYMAMPGYDFEKFRKEAPEKYESYADMDVNEWISLKIVVDGLKAKLYVGESKYPSLIVNDLKMGESNRGTIGLFTGFGTECYYRDLIIKKID
jgi:hypothetical protein